MEEDLEINEIIQLKYSRMLYILIDPHPELTLENDDIYQKLDFKIQELLSTPDIAFTDAEKGIRLSRELENMLKARVNNICEHFHIMKDMIKLQDQTINELKK